MTTPDLLGDVTVYALRCGLLLAVGLALPRLLRLGHPRALLAYWHVLLPVVVLSPLLELPAGFLHQADGGPGALRVVAEAAVVTARASGLPEAPPAGLLGLLLAAGCLAATVRLALGLFALARLARGSRPLASPLGFLPALEERLSVTAALRVCRTATSPATFGWRSPVVLLPEAFEQMPEGEQEAVLCHELLHVRRRDWLVTLFEEALRACLWFHPAVGLLLSRAALAREQVVDQDVVRLTRDRRAYLEALLRIASLPPRPLGIPVPALHRGSQLARRVALLAQEVSMNRARITASLAAAALSLAAAGAVGAAALAPGAPAATPAPPRAEAPPRSDAPVSTEAQAPVRLSDLKGKGKLVEPRLVSKESPVYPEEARKARLAGEVVVEAEVTAEGAVRNPRVVKSSDKVFDAPTLAAVSKWKYQPATLNGKPVAVLFTVTTRFRLD
ncbi:MAG: M56 family peptidase [Acidobacteria bacterium]|nr:MAG: M56 family peptidase [Acidobacteriota bacterium]